MKDVREALSGRDRQVWREIQAFETARGSMATSMARLATAPLETLVPGRLRRAMQDALGGVVELVQKASDQAAGPAQVLEGTAYGSLEHLRAEASIDDVLGLTEEATQPAILKATLQGAGLGLGGVMLAIADVPILLYSHLQLLIRVGMCAGHDLRAPVERPFLLGLLKLGYCLADGEARREALDELAERMDMYVDEEEAEPEEVARAVFLRSLGAFSDKIGPLLLRRRFGAMMPVLGSLFGAGANYALTRDVGEAARHTMAKRFLVRRARGRP